MVKRFEYAYQGHIDDAIRYIESVQMLDEGLWKRFVDQFREKSDSDCSWRGEFWGKLMRGASMTYSYTQNPELYQQLVRTVKDMLSTQEADGRISTYTRKTEFNAWDLWCRKYVLLGMEYFLEICEDPDLQTQVLASMCRQLDYIICHVGPEKEGKKPIAATGELIYRGANSASILEPVARLYSLTGKQRYLDFATYLVDAGVLDVANLYQLALEDRFQIYQYPVTKAYEIISCFEGLLEYYSISGNDWQRTAAINFGDQLLKNEFTVIGSGGCTFEFFDHAIVRQANPEVDLAQETCVTVTMMKYLYRLNLLTGDSKYVDAFEISLYNAYFGSFNTEQKVNEKMLRVYPAAKPDAFPFDSYSPLTSGVRGRQVGGLRKFSDDHCYGCCAAIGAAGNGLVPKMQMLSEDGYVMNLYINGCVTVTDELGITAFLTETEYPKDGYIKVTVNPDQTKAFSLSLRIPAWSAQTRLLLNGEPVCVNAGYTRLNRTWTAGDTVELFLDMRTRAIHSIGYGEQILMNKPCWRAQYIAPNLDVEHPDAKNHVALQRGPIILAQDSRLGYCLHDPSPISIMTDGCVDATLIKSACVPFKCLVSVKVPLENGKEIILVDYGSAGKLWTEESRLAAWILTK